MASVDFTCASCGKSFRVPDRYLGRELKCPNCGQVFCIDPTSAAGASDDQMEQLLTLPPRPLYLVFLSFVFFAVAVWEFSIESYGPNGVTIIRYLVAFAGTAYWFFCVYRIHVMVQELTLGAHPISPARAVWFHFIPFFNFYWLFKWPNELAKTLNAKAGRVIVPEGIIALPLFLGVAILRWDTSLGWIVLSLWMAFVLNRMRKVADF